jgi:hypothetical protein
VDASRSRRGILGHDVAEGLHAEAELVHHGEAVAVRCDARRDLELAWVLAVGADEGQQPVVGVEDLDIAEGRVGDIDEARLVDGDVLGAHEIGEAHAHRPELVQVAALGVEDLDARVELVDHQQSSLLVERQR